MKKDKSWKKEIKKEQMKTDKFYKLVSQALKKSDLNRIANIWRTPPTLTLSQTIASNMRYTSPRTERKQCAGSARRTKSSW